MSILGFGRDVSPTNSDSLSLLRSRSIRREAVRFLIALDLARYMQSDSNNCTTGTPLPFGYKQNDCLQTGKWVAEYTRTFGPRLDSTPFRLVDSDSTFHQDQSYIHQQSELSIKALLNHVFSYSKEIYWVKSTSLQLFSDKPGNGAFAYSASLDSSDA